MSLGTWSIDRTFILSLVVGVILFGVAVAIMTGAAPSMEAWASESVAPAGQLGVSDRVSAPLASVTDLGSKIPSASLTAAADGRASLFDASPLKAAPVPVTRTVPRATSSTTSRAATSGWSSAKCSWYGPGFYGNTMAGGGVLTPDSMVVAHRSLPFGTRVQLEYNGRTVTAVVQDRGPFVGGRTFDLGPGTARALGFDGVHTVRYRILGS